ncbi:MAG: hypothetical protein AAF581_10945 [Planctomycetota bacterium]
MLSKTAAVIAVFVLLTTTSSAWGIERTRLTLKGRHLVEGRAFDLGEEYLQVYLRQGQRRILKRDVLSWGFDEHKDKEAQGLLLLTDGHEVEGNVEFDSEQGGWVIRMELGSARYPVEQVVHVAKTNGVCRDGSFTPRTGFAKRLDAAIARVVKGEAKAKDIEYIDACGFFAVPKLEAAVAKEDCPAALVQLLLTERTLIAIPEKITVEQPKFIETLQKGPAKERVDALHSAFILHGDEIFPLLVVLLQDDRQPPAVRGFSVEVLQRMRRYRDLVEAYQAARGAAQLAVALALGDAGYYIGIPTLIEALSIEDADVRALAARKLEEYTGESFGYKVSGEASVRRTAIAQWQAWWRSHRADVEELVSTKIVESGENLARIRAVALSRQGNRAWARNETREAYKNYRAAAEEDPTYLQPLIALGILSYVYEARFSEAEQWFLRALKRAPEEGEDGLARLAYYHLGRIAQDSLNYGKAKQAFQKALALDANYADAWFDLGQVIYDEAVRVTALTTAQRRSRLEEAAETWERGIVHLTSYRKSLSVLTRRDLPVGTDLPFSQRDHNRSLKDFRSHLRTVEGRFAFSVARARLALGQPEEALGWGRQAVESPLPRPEYHLLMATIFEALKRPMDAENERDAAKALEKSLRDAAKEPAKQ